MFLKVSCVLVFCLRFSFCSRFFPFLERIFKVYILLKGSAVDRDCDVVGVSTGGEKGHNC